MKFAPLAAALMALGAVALAGCKQQPAEPAAQASESAVPSDNGPDMPDGMGVGMARLVLPAVKGNPGAVYFEVSNIGDADNGLVAASVEGAESAAFHTTTEAGGMVEMTHVPLPKHTTLKFAPGGSHVMVMGVPDTLKPGDSVEVTLTFEGGDKMSFPAEVKAAGDAD